MESRLNRWSRNAVLAAALLIAAGCQSSQNDSCSRGLIFVDQVAAANVRSVRQPTRERSPILREMLDKGQSGLAGGMYDLSTGEVQFFSN